MTASSAMYSLAQTPYGSRQPQISVTLDLRGTPNNISEVWLYVLHESRLDLIRRSDEGVLGPFEAEGTRHYCCSERLFSRGECPRFASPLINWTSLPVSATDMALELFRPPFNGREPVTERFNVTRSGFWHVYLVNCAPFANATLVGEIQWMNPYGYLPADIAALMPFYISMCLAHALLAGWWWFRVYRVSSSATSAQEGVVLIQKLFGLLLLLMWLEQFFFALDWSIYNYETGTISVFFNLVSALLAALRNVACFTLLLVVAMGWNIFRPKLTKYWQQAVACYGTAALIFSTVWQFSAMLDYTPQLDHLALPEVALLLVSVPAIFTDFGYVGWIALEMYRSSYLLARHKQPLKLSLYKQLALVMAIGALVAIVLFITESAFSMASLYSEFYRSWWIFTAAWPVILFCVVFTIAWQLRPGPGSEKLRQIEIDEEMEQGKDEEGEDERRERREILDDVELEERRDEEVIEEGESRKKRGGKEKEQKDEQKGEKKEEKRSRRMNNKRTSSTVKVRGEMTDEEESE